VALAALVEHGAAVATSTRTRAGLADIRLAEFDLVMGGGVVPSSLVLVGGEPGVGKTTLLMQLCQALGCRQRVLYASGEESAEQLSEKARRLQAAERHNSSGAAGVDSLDRDGAGVDVVCENNMEVIEQLALDGEYDVLIIDSIQTCHTPEHASSPGAVVQIRLAADRLLLLAKRHELTVFVAGHVTKDGAIAGPKLLEHLARNHLPQLLWWPKYRVI
jgi:DNA repair protein RadA/Sms